LACFGVGSVITLDLISLLFFAALVGVIHFGANAYW